MYCILNTIFTNQNCHQEDSYKRGTFPLGCCIVPMDCPAKPMMSQIYRLWHQEREKKVSKLKSSLIWVWQYAVMAVPQQVRA